LYHFFNKFILTINQIKTIIYTKILYIFYKNIFVNIFLFLSHSSHIQVIDYDLDFQNICEIQTKKKNDLAHK